MRKILQALIVAAVPKLSIRFVLYIISKNRKVYRIYIANLIYELHFPECTEPG